MAAGQHGLLTGWVKLRKLKNFTKTVLISSRRLRWKFLKAAIVAGKLSVLLLYTGFFLIYISSKIPDGYILPLTQGRGWPTIVVEVGYTENTRNSWKMPRCFLRDQPVK